MIRRAIAKSAPCVVRAVSKPPPPADPNAELRKRVSTQVERLQAAVAWNDRLAAEFEEAEEEVGVVRTPLGISDTFIDTFALEMLRAIIAEVNEQVSGLVESRTRLQEEVCELGREVASLEGLVSGLKERFQRLASSVKFLGNHVDWLQQELADLSVEFETQMISTHMTAVESPVETFAVQPPACEEPPAESPVETPAVASLAASPPLDAVLDPVVLDPVLDPVALDSVMDPVPSDPVLDPAVVLNPVLDSPALDPVLDPQPPVPPDPVDLRSPASVLDPILDPAPSDVLSASSVDKPPDEISVGSAFDSASVLCSGSPGSPVFGPAIGLAPVEKPPDEDLHDSRTPSVPLSSCSVVPDRCHHDPSVLDPGLDPVPPDPVDLAVAVSLLEAPISEGPPMPVSISPPVCLFGPPFCDYVARDDAHHRPHFRSSRRRLRQARRLLARKPPEGNSRRHLRQRSQTPNKNFHCFGSLPARKLPPQSPASEKYSLAPASATPVCPPVPRRPPDRRRRERLSLDLRSPAQSPAPSYGPLPRMFRC
jgi:hypothetical protein